MGAARPPELAPGLALVPATWCDELEAELAPIADIARHLDALRAGIEAGRMQALWVVVRGRKVGAMIWELERDDHGAALVIHALACDPVPGFDLVATIAGTMDALGRAAGATWLRFWTARPGLVRRAERLGFDRRYVMERAIA